jgi:hypothetical protein
LRDLKQNLTNKVIKDIFQMTRNFKTIYLTIAVQVEDTADCLEVVEDLDYDIKHPKIIDSEIIEHQVWEEEI